MKSVTCLPGCVGFSPLQRYQRKAQKEGKMGHGKEEVEKAKLPWEEYRGGVR